MDSSPVGNFPIELFFRILDFLDPHEYSGLLIALAGTTASRATTIRIFDRLNSEWTRARSTSCHPN
jgi:hypothetical protein